MVEKSPVDMLVYPISYDGFHTCQVVGNGISELSTGCFMISWDFHKHVFSWELTSLHF